MRSGERVEVILLEVVTDASDGRLWKEWLVKDGTPFLEVPGNLLLMLNIDWFKPFVHTQYNVGVIYLVIQNLPRTVQFWEQLFP